MTQPTKSKVPKIRFKGFAGAWEEKTLGQLCEPLSYGLNAAAMKYDGRNKYLRITDIDDETREFRQSDITSPKKDLSLLESYMLKTGDLVFARTGASVGKTYLYKIKDGRVFFAGFLIRARTKTDVDEGFVFQSTLTSNYGAFVKLTSQRSGQPGINAQEYSSFLLNCPAPAEQTQIGGYFREVDRLIGLQQRKHDKLVTLKKAMLHAMFPQPGATTPKIRFKGFEGDWVEKKLGDSMTNLANNTLSRANLNYRSGLAKNVHYGDILVRFGEVLDVQSDGVPFVSDDALARKFKSSSLENGDIVIADAAEDETVGKCTEVRNSGDQIVLAGLHTIALRPLTHFAPFYLGYYLNSDAYHTQLLSIMQGTKVLSISKTAIKQTVMCFPRDEAEQQKIGRYFRTLDELLSKHALQLQKLKQLKAACLEKMFV
jgi:type I restriction enzyme S subunit